VYNILKSNPKRKFDAYNQNNNRQWRIHQETGPLSGMGHSLRLHPLESRDDQSEVIITNSIQEVGMSNPEPSYKAIFYEHHNSPPQIPNVQVPRNVELPMLPESNSYSPLMVVAKINSDPRRNPSGMPGVYAFARNRYKSIPQGIHRPFNPNFRLTKDDDGNNFKLEKNIPDLTPDVKRMQDEFPSMVGKTLSKMAESDIIEDHRFEETPFEVDASNETLVPAIEQFFSEGGDAFSTSSDTWLKSSPTQPSNPNIPENIATADSLEISEMSNMDDSTEGRKVLVETTSKMTVTTIIISILKDSDVPKIIEPGETQIETQTRYQNEEMSTEIGNTISATSSEMDLNSADYNELSCEIPVASTTAASVTTGLTHAVTVTPTMLVTPEEVNSELLSSSATLFEMDLKQSIVDSKEFSAEIPAASTTSSSVTTDPPPTIPVTPIMVTKAEVKSELSSPVVPETHIKMKTTTAVVTKETEVVEIVAEEPRTLVMSIENPIGLVDRGQNIISLTTSLPEMYTIRASYIVGGNKSPSLTETTETQLDKPFPLTAPEGWIVPIVTTVPSDFELKQETSSGLQSPYKVKTGISINPIEIDRIMAEYAMVSQDKEELVTPKRNQREIISSNYTGTSQEENTATVLSNPAEEVHKNYSDVSDVQDESSQMDTRGKMSLHESILKTCLPEQEFCKERCSILCFLDCATKYMDERQRKTNPSLFPANFNNLINTIKDTIYLLCQPVLKVSLDFSLQKVRTGRPPMWPQFFGGLSKLNSHLASNLGNGLSTFVIRNGMGNIDVLQTIVHDFEVALKNTSGKYLRRNREKLKLGETECLIPNDALFEISAKFLEAYYYDGTSLDSMLPGTSTCIVSELFIVMEMVQLFFSLCIKVI